ARGCVAGLAEGPAHEGVVPLQVLDIKDVPHNPDRPAPRIYDLKLLGDNNTWRSSHQSDKGAPGKPEPALGGAGFELCGAPAESGWKNCSARQLQDLTMPWRDCLKELPPVPALSAWR